MKKSICLAASLLALNLTPVVGQQPSSTFSQRVVAAEATRQQAAADAPALTKFNLDFPGGTPAQLIKAIEKETGKPLNAIIPTEDADLQMPPLKMDDVAVPQLFAALEAASRKTIAVSSGFERGYVGNYTQMTTDYGFKTADSPLTDASIWYFHVEKPSLPPMVSTEKVCQFYSLSPYLDRGFTVDDITTAIQTGWKMAGETPTPELNYHKETKLLIAYGEPDKLKTIADVLKTLPFSAVTAHAGIAYEQALENLQSQINVLKKQMPLPAPASTNSSEEKSGK